MLKMKLEPHHIVLFDVAEALVKVLVESRYQLFDFSESTLSNLTNPLEM